MATADPSADPPASVAPGGTFPVTLTAPQTVADVQPGTPASVAVQLTVTSGPCSVDTSHTS